MVAVPHPLATAPRRSIRRALYRRVLTQPLVLCLLLLMTLQAGHWLGLVPGPYHRVVLVLFALWYSVTLIRAVEREARR